MTYIDETRWPVLLLNPQAITSVFGDADPDLSNARLLGIDISEGGSLLTFRLSLDRRPARQPKRKGFASANATSIEFQCLALEKISITASSGDSRVSCEIAEKEVGREIRIKGPSTDAVIQCGFLKVNRIFPYVADYSPHAM